MSKLTTWLYHNPYPGAVPAQIVGGVWSRQGVSLTMPRDRVLTIFFARKRPRWVSYR